MSDSFITLSRKILLWEWYTDANTMRLFMHCLLKANWRDKKWRGINVKRGSFITSQQNLSDDLGLSRKQIQLSLDKLIQTNEIEKEGHSKYTLVTVVKYDDYQKKADDEAQQRHNKSTTKAQQKHTTNNSNNINNENNNIINRAIEENFKLVFEDEKYLKAVTDNLKIDIETLRVHYSEFNKHLELRSDTVKTKPDYVSHFRSWYIKKYNINLKTGRSKSIFKNTL